jgi:nitrate ABC transporter ATP-binding subunit
MMTNRKFVECWRLRKEFKTDKGPFLAVRDFSLNVALGEFVSIIGHSGCGKSTVLSMIAGLHTLDGGGLIVNQKEVSGAGPDRAVVFQSPNLLPWLTAIENITLGLEQVLPRSTHAEREEVAHLWLARVGLAKSGRKKPAELSQGMQQRVGIARAFALDPEVLLLDEPFGMLDSLTRMELQDVLLDVWSEHRITTLMVTHDVEEAVFLSDRIVMMTDGPAATIGKVLAVHLPRPRNRDGFAESPDAVFCSESVLTFLDHPVEEMAA